jgi:hypothetical protein
MTTKMKIAWATLVSCLAIIALAHLLQEWTGAPFAGRAGLVMVASMGVSLSAVFWHSIWTGRD